MGLWWSRHRPKPAEKRQTQMPYWPVYSTGSSFADLNLNAAETSLQSVAVRTAVDLICSLGSELPITVFSGRGAERKERPTPEHLQDPSGDGNGLEDWCYQALMSWLLRGNLYGDILEKAPSGYVTQANLFYPDDVRASMVDGEIEWRVKGEIVPRARMLHRRVNPVPGRVLGLSPIAFHANQIGLSLAATRYGGQWFTDGAHPSALLSNTETDIDQTVAAVAKERFMAALRGTREPVVLGKGWEYKQLQIAPNESQFLETQGFTEAQCARIFGPGIAEVLGYESGGSLTYTNVESRSAHLLVYATNRWFRRLERLLSSMLAKPQYVRIDRDALLQSTTLERYRAHALALTNQWRVINEVRDDEDMPPVPWGNEPVQQQTVSEDTQPTGAEAPQPVGSNT